MGNNANKDPMLKRLQAQNSQIDRAARKKENKQQQEIKMLLLGAGDSGKSTVFKQMIRLHGGGFSPQERSQYKLGARLMISKTVKEIIDRCEEMKIDILSGYPELKVQILHADRELGIDMKDDELLRIGKILWEDRNLPQLWEYKSRFQFPCNFEYFMNDMDRILAPAYEPTDEDALRTRIMTLGMIQRVFQMDELNLRLLDVGGQRNERKKWIHQFEGVNAVIYVAALSEYDQRLYEDENVNRVTEAMTLFNEVCNSGWFPNACVIIFFNKMDLFDEKVKRANIKDYFSDYNGGMNTADGREFFSEKFLAINRDIEIVISHFTCATDEKAMEVVLDGVKAEILRAGMQGLM